LTVEANQNKYNAEARQWGEKLRMALASNIARLSSKGKGELVKGLRANYRTSYGDIESISYKFPRHGVFFAKGAGRGYKVTAGKIQRVPSGNSKVLTSTSVNRQAKDWFNNAIDVEIGSLINIVATYRADQAVDATDIKIR
jgi:hypothetical protein